MYRFFIKPFFDFIISMLGVIIASPLFCVITLVLIFINRGKPFLLQKRPGKNGQIFQLIKFRSMNDLRDASGNLLPSEERITKVGSFLRTTSLDEIPQIINILKGDMSLIGPRPLLSQYLDLYNAFQNRRHEVKPGITGWAQINGRNATSWSQRFEYDVWYVEHISFVLDIKIFFKTIKKVFIREGINNSESVDMPLFQGNYDH